MHSLFPECIANLKLPIDAFYRESRSGDICQKCSKLLLKTPLWKQKVPRYPVYIEGNPQNRVLLCHFWMKMVKSERDTPKNHTHFQVHPQMSKLDVKQYLEKMYNVSVLDVRTRIVEGKPIYHFSERYQIGREDDKKFAFVTMGNGETFEFPEMFKDIKLPHEKNEEDYYRMKDQELKIEQKNWDRLSIPPWFR